MNHVAMTPNDWTAIDYARDHCLRTLSAVRAADLPDTDARNALDVAHQQLTNVLRALDAIRARARVTHDVRP